MKRLLLALLLAVSAQAQPVLRNSYSTNQTGRTPNVLPTSTSAIYPMMVLNPDGTGTDRQILYSQYLIMTGTNASLGGDLSLSGRTNKLSILNDTLMLDGVEVASNTTTNTYSTVNITNVLNYHVAKGGQLILTNDLLFEWKTLTMSGSNVSTINLTNGLLHKLTLTNDAWFGAPINFPGTNFGRTFQIALIQDGTGGRRVTMTNSSWLMNGSGTSTNAVPSILTNANSVSILTWVTSPFSSSVLYGVPTTIGP